MSTLPWEIEKLNNAFQRAYSMFSSISEGTAPYISGIDSTLKFLPLDFARHNIYM